MVKEKPEDLFQKSPVHFVYFYLKLNPGTTLERLLGESPWAPRIVKWAIRQLLEADAIESQENGGFVAVLEPAE